MSIDTECGKCGTEYDTRRGECPVCSATFRLPPTKPAAQRPLSSDGGESTVQSVACPTQAEQKREYTMRDWWNDLDNPHRMR